jgi:hypothetical protein
MSRRLLFVVTAAAVGTGTTIGDAFAPAAASSAFAFAPRRASGRAGTTAASTTSLSMVLEKPVQKKLAKIEELKIASDHLVHPLLEVRTCSTDSRQKKAEDFCRSVPVSLYVSRSGASPSPFYYFFLFCLPA